MKKTIGLLLMIGVMSTANRFDYVREYLNQQKKVSQREFNSTEWFPNSNLIAFGYNPIQGTPVCYSGSCDFVASRNPIFQLSYTENPVGKCTSKLIPKHVKLLCLPSFYLESQTESIHTLKQVWESTSKGISFGPDIKYMPFTAAYKYSRETRFMIDRTIKQAVTSVITRATIIYAKLSMLESLMELSNTFRYVIQEMPCCEYNDAIRSYVKEFIIEYFGLTYINELTLGGLAQKAVFIANERVRELQQSGVDVTRSAHIDFLSQFNVQLTSLYNRTQQNKFEKSYNESSSIKLGGDQSITKIDEWIESISKTPAIMNIAVRDISGLLNSKRFPHDPSIQRKFELVNISIQDYINSLRAFCINNCTDSDHGHCNLSNPYLQLGTCECKPGWKGIDCSEKNRTKLIIEPEGGSQGTYRNWTYCPEDTWAIGFRQRVEKYQDVKDDSAVNALQLFCGDDRDNEVTGIISYEGLWGTWSNPVYCSGPKNYLRTMQFRVDSPVTAIDLVGVADSIFICMDGSQIQATNGQSWGIWRVPASCPTSTAICGFQLNFQPSQGLTGDDTAMNGAKFACCYTY